MGCLMMWEGVAVGTLLWFFVADASSDVYDSSRYGWICAWIMAGVVMAGDVVDMELSRSLRIGDACSGTTTACAVESICLIELRDPLAVA